jgi:Mg-chelatase subunit ChlD
MTVYFRIFGIILGCFFILIFLGASIFHIINLFESNGATLAYYLEIAFFIIMAIMYIFTIFCSIMILRENLTVLRMKKSAGSSDSTEKTTPLTIPADSPSQTKRQSSTKTVSASSYKTHPPRHCPAPNPQATLSSYLKIKQLSTKQPVPTGIQKRRVPSAAVKKTHTDLVGLVGFHDRGFIVAKPAEPHAHWLQERVASLPKRVAGNSTNMTDGLRKGLEILEKTPKNRYRRIWLLTDGKNNREQDKLMSMIAQAGLLHVNINTIGFGNPGSNHYDPDMLKKISSATHNGRFVPVSSLKELSAVLQDRDRIGLGKRKAETTVLVIDCSPSMTLSMGNRQRIEVVVEAITHLLHYKQKCFS